MADEQDSVVECWAPIPGHEGYEASTLGQIRSVQRWVISPGRKRVFPGKVLRQFTLWNGYKTTHLGKNLMNIYVHRLVALTFLGPMPHGLEICHNDGVKTNNRLDNLRYDTRKANSRDSVKHGTIARGSRLPQTRLTPEDVRAIRKSELASSELAQLHGITRDYVNEIKRGVKRQWLEDVKSSEDKSTAKGVDKRAD